MPRVRNSIKTYNFSVYICNCFALPFPLVALSFVSFRCVLFRLFWFVFLLCFFFVLHLKSTVLLRSKANLSVLLLSTKNLASVSLSFRFNWKEQETIIKTWFWSILILVGLYLSVETFVEALQVHSNTLSHWSSRSTVCFPFRGSAIRIPGMHKLTMEPGFSVSAVSLH